MINKIHKKLLKFVIVTLLMAGSSCIINKKPKTTDIPLEDAKKISDFFNDNLIVMADAIKKGRTDTIIIEKQIPSEILNPTFNFSSDTIYYKDTLANKYIQDIKAMYINALNWYKENPKIIITNRVDTIEFSKNILRLQDDNRKLKLNIDKLNYYNRVLIFSIIIFFIFLIMFCLLIIYLIKRKKND